MLARTLLAVAAVAAALCVGPISGGRADAGLTPAQRKELTAIRSQLVRIKLPVKRDLIDEAETKTSEAEQRLNTLATDAGLADDESHVAPLRRMIALRRDAIAKAKAKEQKDSQHPPRSGGGTRGKKNVKSDRVARKGEGAKIGFVVDIAPIFVARCLGCHGKEAKGGLRLDTFAGMERGGKNGPLLVEGEAENSLIMARLTAPGQGRMPKDADPLGEADCLKIAAWIAGGAKFDGDDKNKPLDKLSVPAKPKVPVTVARPTGNETISFTRDIAPFMVERCVRCHGGSEPKGGLSLETFDGLLTGGKSGPEIAPGNLDESRLWSLVGKQRPMKMPPGDAFITRTHYNSLRTWILEGAKFDGGDPQRPLASMVASAAQKRDAELVRMTPQELRGKRRKRSEELWRRALPKESPQRVENEGFLLMGNVSSERLEQVARWAADATESAQTFFDDRAAPVFKGGLTIFVLKDRFSYEEFSQVILQREPPAAVHGHAVVTPDLTDAYLAVENLADASAEDGPTARTNVIEHLTAAFLMRSDKKLPDWLLLGSGRVLTARSASGSAKPQWSQVYRLAGSLEKPDDLFSDGTFSPTAARDVGAALVTFLLEAHGKPPFVRFVNSLRNGAAQKDALRDVYGSDSRGMAEEFLARARQAGSATRADK